ncbi:MAG: PDZ domain-containing protein [Bacteroidetes bacterium]|nr:PDZ domain-containing protein [Bacteroidota bacterium]MBL6943403.1 PDZ domain-containing protein [Bacteroidales bacterium]
MNKNNNKTQIYLPIAFSLVLIAGMWLGSLLVSNKKISNTILPIGNQSYNKLGDALDYIVQDYVDTVDLTTLETDAIRGMLEKLDPHSVYITKEEFHEVNDPLLGSFEGIGISFRIEKDTITVINPIPGGPSEKVGLMAGDRIVKIDDTLVAGIGITNNKAIRKLKGNKGTKVKVSNYRRGVPKLIDFTITRDVIPTFSLDVAYMVDDSIGYIKLNKFSATTYDEFKEAAGQLKDKGMTKLILDLRGNPGGLLQAAINISDEFLKDGKLIVYTEGKNRSRRHAFATKAGDLEQIDVAVLIDESSASASEIVAGALQDNDKGLIIGRRSFGKGLVQEQINLPDGSAIRLTVSRYYTPTGRSIQQHYENGDAEGYYEEHYHRYINGEMKNKDSIHFDDSLKYITPGGKIVYGGGGIMPDIFVPLITDSIHTYYNLLANKGLIFQFAFDYTDKHRARLNKFTDFETFNRKFNMDNNTFNELVAYADEKGIKSDDHKIQISKEKIANLFKAFVGRNVLDEKGFYPIYHSVDTTFNRAVYEIRNLN